MDVGTTTIPILLQHEKLSWEQRQRLLLPLKAVLLTPLDELERPVRIAGGIKKATGFIRIENGIKFLYACWHTVTGLDRNTLAVPSVPPEPPRKLRLTLQQYERQPAFVESVGGSRDLVIELYRGDGRTPAWMQDRHYIPSADVENFGFRFPFWHDLVKLVLPSIELASAQATNEREVCTRLLLPTERVFIVGYPHGYSALDNPTPVVLTAHVAASLFSEKRHEFLVDRLGAPGMSGSPVFLEDKSGLRLIGVYTGAIHPSRPEGIALGTCADLRPYWGGRVPALVPVDSTEVEPLDEGGRPVLES